MESVVGSCAVKEQEGNASSSCLHYATIGGKSRSRLPPSFRAVWRICRGGRRLLTLRGDRPIEEAFRGAVKGSWEVGLL